MARWLTVAIVAAAGACGSSALGQGCRPHWERLATDPPDNGVDALGVVIDGAGTALFAGGKFTTVGGVTVNRIGRWDGVAWTPLGSGIPGEFNTHGFMGCCATVHAIVSDPAGGVCIAGNFIQAGGEQLESVGTFQNGVWRSLAGGVENVGCTGCAWVVYAAIRFGDPGQGSLYAAGTFDLAGGVAAAKIARWNGSGWDALGAGIGAAPGDLYPPVVQALAGFQGGLYASGIFSRAGAVLTNAIARWDGQGWTDVGGGVDFREGQRRPSITAMAVYDDGRGQALYIGGILDSVGGVAARNIARWNGASWEDVGGGVGSGVNDRIWTLAVFDDGAGPALYAGGGFADAGGIAAANIAKWDGHAWSALDAGANGEVDALAAFSDGAVSSLYVGGWFTDSGGGAGSPYLSRWVACPVCYANCDGSTVEPVLNVNDFLCFQGRFAAGDARANCDGSTTPPVLNVNDFLCFQSRFAAGCG